MASIPIQPDLVHGPAASGPRDNYLTHGHGLVSWLFTLDHKRIGVMYLVSVLTAFLLGGIFALLIRTHLVTPEGILFKANHDFYNRVFTLHGAVMVFLVLVPGIPGALGNFVLPIQLGAKDVAFPRLNLGSLWLYWIGAACALISIAMGAIDTGWTFYTPYSVTTMLDPNKSMFQDPVIWMVIGVFILGFSSIFTGMNFIVTMHKLRPPGMTWFRMPLLLWALYATALIQILATPVLGITVLLLAVERTMQVGIFNSALGGDPVLFQHFFWFYSHPAVYIMILPAMGVISELISCFSRRHIFGYRFVAMSSVAIAVIGFLVWGHHMFVNGQSSALGIIFSFITMVVAIPSAIKTFNWLATLYKGSIEWSTPMVYAFFFLFLFAIGGLTGLFLGALATDVHLHDTYFVVAHFHYVMVGGNIFAFVGGIHYWWPKMFGKMFNQRVAIVAGTIAFIGFNLTFFPQFVMGSHGMPRRYATYDPQFQLEHILSTIGAWLQLAGFGLTGINLVASLFRGEKAPANPWGAATLEWSCTSPPPHDNFKTTPTVGDPYEYGNLVYDDKVGGYVRDNSTAAPYATTVPIPTE